MADAVTRTDLSSADRHDLVVVGGGIAGLVIARDAARAGLRVVLLDASDHRGGMLRRGDLAGIPIDLGAESFATRTDGVAELVADLPADPALEIVAPAPGGAHLAALADGEVLHAPLPRRTVLGIPADPLADDVVRILGDAAARRVADEPYADAPAAAAEEPSLADLVAQRCGPELVRRLVDPLCRSVYSAPADRLYLSRLHPALWEAYLTGGSLVAAAASLARPERAGAAVAGVAGGMWRLADAVARDAERHGARLRTGAAVVRVTPASESGDIAVELAGGEVFRGQRVVIATGATAARRLLGGTPAETAPVRVVAALVHAPALDRHPVGSGVIAAVDVPSAAKALTHVTAKWAWAAASVPAGQHIVRLSARDADAPLSSPEDLAREIALLTGVDIAAADVLAVASAEWTDAVASAPADDHELSALAARGIHLAGATVAGTGLASVVPHARELARELVALHTATHTTSPSDASAAPDHPTTSRRIA